MDGQLHRIEQDLVWLETAATDLTEALEGLLARHAAFAAWLDAQGL